MKKIIILSLLAAINLLGSCAIHKSEPFTGKVVDTSDPDIRNGEIVYMAACQKCHPSGEGGLGPALNPNPAPQFVYRFQVRHGLGVMPSFKKDEISVSDLRDMSAYLKALKKL